MDFEAYGGRRFLLCICCSWISTGLVIGGYIDGPIYRDLILGTVAAYIAGNTTQKIKQANTE